MAITLTVEDGSVVTNANTYNSLAELRAYATQRNIVLSDDDDIVSGFGILAMDYLEMQSYLGERVSAAQTLAFPRKGIVIDYIAGVKNEYADDEIPAILKLAQCRLVVDLTKGVDLQPSYGVVDRIKRKKVGPLEKEFFDTPGVMPILSAVDALLAPLLLPSSFGLRTLRV